MGAMTFSEIYPLLGIVYCFLFITDKINEIAMTEIKSQQDAYWCILKMLYFYLAYIFLWPIFVIISFFETRQ